MKRKTRVEELDREVDGQPDPAHEGPALPPRSLGPAGAHHAAHERTRTPRRPRWYRRFRWWGTGLVPGVLAALLVAAFGAWYVPQQPTTWQSQVQLLVSPKVQSDSSATSSYYETLSSGQLPATAAALLNDKQLLRSATSSLSDSTRAAVSATATVLPESAVVVVQVTAPDRATAEEVANTIARDGSTKVSALLDPYTLTVIGSASHTAARTSMGFTEWVILFALAAVVVGLIVQQLVSRTRRRSPRSAAESHPRP